MSFSFVQMPWATSKKEAQNKFNEGYESEVSSHLKALDIDHHWKDGHLHVDKRDHKDVKKRLSDTDMEMPKIKVNEAKAKKDWDGDGEIETGKQEWKGSRDKAIKKAMKDDEDPVAKKKKKGKSDTKDEPEGENGETADMNPKVESVQLDKILSLNEDSFDAYLDTLTYEELEQLEEGIIGGTARLLAKPITAPLKLIGKGIKKGVSAAAHRMSAAGRADAADARAASAAAKLSKIQKKKADIKRREIANAKTAKLKAQIKKEKGPGIMDKIRGYVDPKPISAGTEPDSNKSNIREKLFSVVERKDHGRTDNSDNWDEKYTGKGAKKMRIDHNGPIDGSIDQRIKDTVKSGREGPTAKGRNSGDATRSGDQKIIQGGTPMKDPAAARVKEALEIIGTVLEANYDIADEIINELSMDTLKSYRQKAKGDIKAKGAKARIAMKSADKTGTWARDEELRKKAAALNKKAVERSDHRDLAKGKMQIKKGESKFKQSQDAAKSTYKLSDKQTSRENFSGTGHSLNGVMNAYADMYTEKVSSGIAQHGLTNDERKGHSSFMKKKHGVTTKYKGSDELEYIGSKKQVRGALDSHYGKGGDQKELHSHIYK